MKHMTSISPKSATFLDLVHRLNSCIKLVYCDLLKAWAANDNEICESSIDSLCPSHSDPISPIVKMRWKQLARNAFNQWTDQNQTNRPHNNNPGNCNAIASKSQPKPAGQNGNGFHRSNNLIDLISLNPPSSEDLLLCERINNWVQLSGHEDSFALAGPGTIWKKRSSDSTEVRVYETLMNEPIAEVIPKFYRDVQYKGDNFIELEDLLFHYKDASIMDIKMGSRTFLESEVMTNKARHDLYEKMVKIDPLEPTREENATKAITKLRYMQFRETLSSSSNLGFRIEGFKVGDDLKHNKNLHMIKRKEDVQKTLAAFFHNKPSACLVVTNRLRKLRKFFENSHFFRLHEVIGSSLLIIYTAEKAGVWMIDFAKTLPLPDNIEIDHRSSWHLGNHEDGYLFGLDNLIAVLEDILRASPS